MHAIQHLLQSRPVAIGRRKSRWLGVVGVAASLLVACGGGGGDAPAPSGGAPSSDSTIPVLSSTTTIAMVVVPSGVSVGADKLSVLTSIGAATPATSGSVNLPIYVNGAQLAIVTSPAGNPMMMGWVDATHTTISAATTAQVLAYFALNGQFLLNEVERQEMIADIPQANGIAALEAVVQGELAANVDAFATSDATLKQAVLSFTTPYFAGAQAHASVTPARKKALGILVTPATQSGIDVVQDPPFAAHLTNSFRRRSHAFVDRISHTTGGADVADPLAVTDFEVKPTVGVSGGVTGALTDIIAAYYGNQPTAYGSITAPDSGTIALPAVDGADKTTYQITVVGPGSPNAVSAGLTATQAAARDEVALRGFAQDFMFPLMANVVLGSGAIDFQAGQGTEQAKFVADMVGSATADLVALAPTLPDLGTKIGNGQWYDAGVDISTTVGGSNTLRTILVHGLEVAVANGGGAARNFGASATFFDKFNKYLNIAGGVLQVIDTSAYLNDVTSSDQADQWSVVVTPEKVGLNPAATNIDIGGTVTLTASVLGIEDTAGYSFHWTTTTQIGDLNEVGGGGRLHQTDYCSSSPQAVFIYKNGATPGATDTVTVQVYAGANCDTAKGPLLGTQQATVTYASNPWLGTWVGSVTSTCGFYSGALTYVITSGGDNVLDIVYNGSGHFLATYSGNTASANDVLTMTLSGNSISLIETDSCQTASFTRQQP